ncbi:hypothetical protein [Cellulomonas aerilata]|uniref:Uncharacterized protein n=1 Tax=Cellulomonas aerilata TaxID=515326 RepID=A0A512DFN2_9CELL|nr:hypothetical protein [Cellulomonas aerilata]GEO35236.1 hypothetical protein CAE01nite_29610 [Cellulomonas aerilata]
MTDGYVVDPEVLRSVAGTLRSRADANGSPGTYGLGGRVDAGRSSGEIAKAVKWLGEELEKATTSLDALADNLQGVADRYRATDEGSARDYDGARTPAPSAGPVGPR